MGTLRQTLTNHLARPLGLIAAGILTPLSAIQAQPWEAVKPAGERSMPPSFKATPATKSGERSLQWSVVSPKPQPPADVQPTATPSQELQWTTLTAEELREQQQKLEQELQNAQDLRTQPPIVQPPSGPTYANYRALWRDGDWLPQISNTVPVGFGPKGVMATFEYRGIDCITGAGLCTAPPNFETYRQNSANQGDAFFDWSLGFGDSSKFFGIVLTAIIEGTETPFASQARQQGSPGFLKDKNLGIHVTRNVGTDTSIRIGVDNLFREVCGNGTCGLPQSAYGVISQRLRLNPDQKSWFANAYLTAGAGNGSFRSLSDQIQSSYLAQRAAGCSTYGYKPTVDCSVETRRNAVFSAYDYGNLFPIGSLGIEVVKGFHLISEWSGRNLNAGLSFRPFPELGLVITPMFENLLPNCDYGCNVWVPDYPGGALLPSNVLTQRARFSIQASIEVKF